MSLYDMSSPKSLDSIDIPVTPEVIRTPKEFKEIDWNTVSNEQSKHPNMKESRQNDAIIIKELQRGKQEKGSSVTR